jgi:hypothetical protein
MASSDKEIEECRLALWARAGWLPGGDSKQ